MLRREPNEDNECYEEPDDRAWRKARRKKLSGTVRWRPLKHERSRRVRGFGK